MSSNVGTPFYKAPECWKRGRDGRASYHRKVDVFSMGLTYLAMLQQLRDPNGKLVPKVEGSLQESEIGTEIGRLMVEHEKYNQPELNVVLHREDDSVILNCLKELIRAATRVNPEHRMTSHVHSL